MKAKNNGLVPFLKWAGGKQWLIPHLKPFLTSNSGRYIEPFLGGGSVFLAIRPKKAWLSDSNQELIETYLGIIEDVDAVIRKLKRFSFTQDCYYAVRNSIPRSLINKAARFIYLNRTCWNGLYRVNQKGKFNVPMGSFNSKPDFIVAERLWGVQRALKEARIACKDFEDACAIASKGDTVYLDPPYTVAHKSNGFLRYNERVFSWEDQLRLAATAENLQDKGCSVILSNADHPSIIELYSKFRIQRVKRKSLVASSKSDRRPITELLITSPHS